MRDRVEGERYREINGEGEEGDGEKGGKSSKRDIGSWRENKCRHCEEIERQSEIQNKTWVRKLQRE